MKMQNEVWFLTGSQHLYGPETLRQVAVHSEEIAKALHADAIIEATVFRDGERIRINAQMTEPATLRYLWAQTYERDVKDVEEDYADRREMRQLAFDTFMKLAVKSLVNDETLYREMKLTTKGEFGGLGFVISMREGNLTVMRVLKNTLARRAVKGTPFEQLSDQMVGPLMYGIASDPVAGAKVIAEFARENELFVIRGGAMPNTKMSDKDVKALALLPSRLVRGEEQLPNDQSSQSSTLLCRLNLPAFPSLPQPQEFRPPGSQPTGTPFPVQPAIGWTCRPMPAFPLLSQATRTLPWRGQARQ